jgi:cytochrome c553
MKVQKIFAVFTSIIFVLTFILNAQETATTKDGKTLFLEAKCNTCHSISSLEIEAKNKSASNKAPDLSKVEIKYEKDFLKKYLHKEESINEKKHPVAYKGTDEDLEILLSFILSLQPHEQPQKESEQK